MHDLPYRLRAFRRQNELSLEALSEKTGLTKSYLSKVERGLSEPSISTVLKLAKAYEVGIAQLLGRSEDGYDESITVVKKAERDPLNHMDAKIRAEAIVGKRLVKKMNPFMIYPPLDDKDRPFTEPHSGEEFMFVVEGRIHLLIGAKRFELEKGDSVYFDAEFPHRVSSLGNEIAQVLVVTSYRD